MNKSNINLGFCLGTSLMRANSNQIILKSINQFISKHRFFIVTIGNKEDEELFWMTGREFITLCADSDGFQVMKTGAFLLERMMSDISEEDLSTLYHIFGEGSRYGGDHFRDLSENYLDNTVFAYYKSLPNHFTSLQSIIDYMKPMGKAIHIYRMQTKTNPFYLEEVQYYGEAEKNCGEFQE